MKIIKIRQIKTAEEAKKAYSSGKAVYDENIRLIDQVVDGVLMILDPESPETGWDVSCRSARLCDLIAESVIGDWIVQLKCDFEAEDKPEPKKLQATAFCSVCSETIDATATITGTYVYIVAKPCRTCSNDATLDTN